MTTDPVRRTALGRAGTRLAGWWPEATVAAYWFTFCSYETLLFFLDVGGLFYPFYLVWATVLLLAVLGPGLVVDGGSTVWMAIFLVATLVAWTRIDHGPTFVMAQRTVAYASCLLVAWQVRSLVGLRWIAVATMATSLVLGVWTIARSAASDFAVRAFLDVDPNVVTLYVAVGALVALSWWVAPHHGARPGRRSDRAVRRRTNGVQAVGLAAVVATSAYATLLLASRGGMVAWTCALVALAWTHLREGRSSYRPRPVRAVAGATGALVAGSIVSLMPGADAAWNRWSTDDASGAGHRFELWRAVAEAISRGGFDRTWFGHGLESAATIVAQVAPSLTAVHQSYLQIAFELGLVGLFAFVALHVTLLRSALRLNARDRGAVVAVVTYLMAACLTLDATDSFAYWVALGTCVATVTHAPRRVAPPFMTDRIARR